MNTYKIIFTREDGTQGTDHFTAVNERQARKDFGECYRHSTATIISIELASTNTPATAFEGCFDLAAENIDNDGACSMADRARSAEKRVAELEDYEEKDAEIARLKDQLKQIQETARWSPGGKGGRTDGCLYEKGGDPPRLHQ